MSKKQFYELATVNGIEVEYTPGGVGRGYDKTAQPFHIMLDAPAGKTFRGTGIHCDGSIQGLDGTTKTDWPRCVRELRAFIAAGFDACTDPDCDICHPD